MRLRSLALIAIAAVLAVPAALLAAPAQAQSPYTVSVTNYQPIPAGATYVTDMNENTELTATAESALRNALEKLGLQYDVNGTVGFKIGTVREYSTPNTGASFDRSNTILNLPFNSGDVKGSPRVGRIYRITLNIFDRASGNVLSRGDVTDTSINTDPVATTPSMVQALLDKVEF